MTVKQTEVPHQDQEPSFLDIAVPIVDTLASLNFDVRFKRMTVYSDSNVRDRAHNLEEYQATQNDAKNALERYDTELRIRAIEDTLGRADAGEPMDPTWDGSKAHDDLRALYARLDSLPMVFMHVPGIPINDPQKAAKARLEIADRLEESKKTVDEDNVPVQKLQELESQLTQAVIACKDHHAQLSQTNNDIDTDLAALERQIAELERPVDNAELQRGEEFVKRLAEACNLYREYQGLLAEKAKLDLSEYEKEQQLVAEALERLESAQEMVRAQLVANLENGEDDNLSFEALDLIKQFIENGEILLRVIPDGLNSAVTEYLRFLKAREQLSKLSDDHFHLRLKKIGVSEAIKHIENVLSARDIHILKEDSSPQSDSDSNPGPQPDSNTDPAPQADRPNKRKRLLDFNLSLH